MKRLVASLFFLMAAFFHASASDLEYFTTAGNTAFFLKENKSSALVHVRLAVKAGFSKQTPSTAGFFSLYAKLFPLSVPEDKSDMFSLCGLKGECLSDGAVFEADIPPELLEIFFESVFSCMSDERFSDSQIEEALEEAKISSGQYAESTAGFINSAIDSVMFREAPWKHDSGIYPALFQEYSPQEARSVLHFIGKNFYTPENSAFFVTGNISQKRLYEMVKDLSGEKKGPVPGNITETDYDTKNYLNYDDNHKFVLVTDDFTDDLTQIIMQYRSLNMNEADICSCIFNGEDSSVKRRIVGNRDFFVRSGDYFSAASAQKNGSSRLIIQSLLENDSSAEKRTISEQARIFSSIIKEESVFSRQDFIRAQTILHDFFQTRISDPVQFMDSLSDYFLASDENPSTAGEFVRKFTDFSYAVQKQSEKNIARKILSETPHIFLIVSRKVFEKERSSFDKDGWTALTEENGSWYKNEFLARNAENERLALLRKDMDSARKELFVDGDSSFADDFYIANIGSIKQGTLSNGIPVIVKENKGSSFAAMTLLIALGKNCATTEKLNMPEILVNSLAANSGIREIKSETKETCSEITVSCRKNEIGAVMQSLANSIIYGDVTPVQADRIVAETNYRILSKNGMLGEQLKNNAFSYLYKDTALENAFRGSLEKHRISFDEISVAYTRLLDASLYTIIVSGDFEAEKIMETGERTFGLLKEHDRRKALLEKTAPVFRKSERNVQLQHLYSSDIPAELAPKEVPVLVPTTAFHDPCQIYFKAPEDPNEREAFNAVLCTVAAMTEQNMKNNDIRCTTFRATPVISAGYIQASNLHRTSVFTASYREARKTVLWQLKNPSQGKKAVLGIKSTWQKKYLTATKSNEGTCALMAEGFLEENASHYLAAYNYMDKADENTFIYILENFVTENPAMTVRSVDSKR